VSLLLDRALRSLLQDLVGLMLVRNFSYNFAPKLSLNHSEFVSSLTGFVLRKCAFLLTFARLTFSAFLAVFFKFLSTVLSRVVTRILQLLGAKNSLFVPEHFVSSNHKLYVYKFKQL
jgi:predicted exporter